jgi:putative spermidine/putrescine transport system substrate-binding protein
MIALAHRASSWITLVAVTTIAAASTAIAQEPPKPESIVVNGSGGAVADAMRKAFFDAFEKKHGIEVVTTSPTDFGKLHMVILDNYG